MLTEYVDAALGKAHYEIIDDQEPYYGEVCELPGVYATGATLEDCRPHHRRHAGIRDLGFEGPFAGGRHSLFWTLMRTITSSASTLITQVPMLTSPT